MELRRRCIQRSPARASAAMTASLSELTGLVKDFCEARDWAQFHLPKDLAIGISTEANELLDLFRFKSEKEIAEKFKDGSYKGRVEEEIADVLFFVLRFAQMNNLDLETSLQKKLAINAAKYPVHSSKGSNRKYNE